MECKDRNNRSSVALPYSFLPSMAAKKLRNTADKVCTTSKAIKFFFFCFFVCFFVCVCVIHISWTVHVLKTGLYYIKIQIFYFFIFL